MRAAAHRSLDLTELSFDLHVRWEVVVAFQQNTRRPCPRAQLVEQLQDPRDNRVRVGVVIDAIALGPPGHVHVGDPVERHAVQERERVIVMVARAVPFLDRCNDELTACGLHPARRTPGPARLSPREQSVARLAARGLTNRQVAAELVISVKTVEVHLGHIFAKLEVSTRTQLAAKLAEQSTVTQ